MLFVALSNLDAATYQVTYQFKIITTALFSVLLLNKSLTRKQWLSLLLLTTGVALVQYPADDAAPKQTDGSSSRLLGLAAVTFACLSSGFAGVFFEKMMKMPGRSVWIQNLYLAIYSTVIGFIVSLSNDHQRIWSEGFFVGYDHIVCLVIFLQAIGGLVIAAIIKYADNIIKGFAASLSIIVSSLASFLILGDFKPSILFVIGAAIVILSTFMYSGSGTKMKEGRIIRA